jgi:hypothetical protein
VIDAADDANAGLTVLQKLYAILPSVESTPSQSLYLFRLSRGRAETLAGGPWPPPPKDDASVAPNSAQATEVSVVTSAKVIGISA